MGDAIDVLKSMMESKLFHGLTGSEIESLTSLAQSKSHLMGEVIISEGDQGDSLYWVESGRLEVLIKSVKAADLLPITSLKRGDFIGEGLLLGKTRRTASVVVRNDAVLRAWNYADCLKLFSEQPALGYKVMTNLARVLSDRLQDMNLQIRNYADVVGPDLLKYF